MIEVDSDSQFPLNTEIIIEQEQINALGQKISKKIWFVVPWDITPDEFIDAKMKISVGGKKQRSDVFENFKTAMSVRS